MTKNDDTAATKPGTAAAPSGGSGPFLITMIVLMQLPFVAIGLDRGLPHTPWESVECAGLLVYTVVVIGWVIHWRASGAILVDCGPNPQRKWVLMAGWLGLLLAASDVIPQLLGEAIDWTELTKDLRTLPMMGLCFALAAGRLQIREKGIWIYGSLVKWNAVEDHHWRGEEQRTLTVEFKKPNGGLGRKARFTVPAELEAAVEAQIAGVARKST